MKSQGYPNGSGKKAIGGAILFKTLQDLAAILPKAALANTFRLGPLPAWAIDCF